jgi:carbamate kinase
VPFFYYDRQKQQAIKTLHSSTMKSYMDHFVKVYNDPKIMAHYQYLRENEQDIHSAVNKEQGKLLEYRITLFFIA